MTRPGSNQLGILSRCGSCWAALLFAFFVIVTSVPMRSSLLSDDQITYWYKAAMLLDQGSSGAFWWDPYASFSYLLSIVYKFTDNINASFIVIYCVTALLYLWAMYRCILMFTSHRAAAAWTAVVSLVPHYTLGMTYWGFAGFEFVKARILIMPLVPIIIGFYLICKKTTHVWTVFVLCGLTAALNFEAVYLGLVLCTFTGLFVLTDRNVTRSVKIISLAGMAAFLIISWSLLAYASILTKVFSERTTIFEISIYEHLSHVLRDQLQLMSNQEYLYLKWEAMSEAFWWALFPPRTSDVVLFLIENVTLVAAAVWGALFMRRTDNDRFKSMIGYCGCVILVAYGYQLFRRITGSWLGWPPDIHEEVRAFKFILFPVFVWIAALLAEQMRLSKYRLVAVILLALFVSPMQMARALPDAVKNKLIRYSEGHLSLEKRPYLEKFIGFEDTVKSVEIARVNDALASQSSVGQTRYIMTTEHRIKLSGFPILISYQDKRTGNPKMFFDDPSLRNDLLPIWQLAYTEIKSAVESGRPEVWLRAADKYGCRYVVVEARGRHERLRPLYEGGKLSCYEVIPPLLREVRI